MATSLIDRGGAKSQPVRLSFKSEERVFIEADNEVRFIVTSKEAAHACKQAQHLEEVNKEWQDQFAGFLKHLHTWSLNHSAQISACYVTAGNEGIEIFFTTKGIEYCHELDDELSALDIDLAKKFPDCPSDTTHFPESPSDTTESFFDLSHAVQVYGK